MAHLKTMETDEFLAYESRSKGAFLGAEWKKQGWLQAWLHRRLPFAMGWQHGVPRIDVKEDQDRNPKRTIFTGSYRCLEEEGVLKEQSWRDKDTNERKNPPVICPLCLMIECVHTMVVRGELHWLEPVFDFDVGVPEKRIYIRAAGLWNGYGAKKLTDEQKGEMEDAQVSPRNDWNQSMQAGLKYILCLVDDAQPGKGVQIMKEGQGLGDKVRIAIAKEMKRNPRNPNLGDPVKTPYAFQFEYKKEETPDKKYDAFRVDLEITEQIQKLIDSDPPNIDMMAGNYQPTTLRAQLERACLIPLPWDDFFTAEAEAMLAEEEEEQPKKAPARAPAPPQTSRQPHRGPAPQGARPRAPAPPQAPARAPAAPPPRKAPEVEMFACDNEACGQPVAATDAKCKACGYEYEVQPAPEPPPPPMRKRSEIGKAAKPAGVPATRGQVVAPAQQPAAGPRRAAPRPPAHTPKEDGEPKTLAEEQADIGFGDFGEDNVPF